MTSYQRDPVQTTKTSVHGAINMLDLAKRTKAKILQASTSEVYGDPVEHPQPETYWGNVNPIGTRACYDEGKRCAETLFFDYHRQPNSLADGLVRLMDSGDDFIGPVNLGNPGEFIVLELAHKVLEQTGSKSELIFNPLPEDDPRQCRPNVNLAQQKLGWQAFTPLGEGLSYTIKDFRARLEKV